MPIKITVSRVGETIWALQAKTPEEVRQETVRILKGSTRLTDSLTALGKKNSLLVISDHYKTKIFCISYHITKHLNSGLLH